MKTPVNRKLLPSEAMLCTFGCSRFEKEILKVINDALAAGQIPDFKIYNLPETDCECRTDRCCWDEKGILDRLKAKGVWDKVLNLLKNPPENIPAHRNPDGSITVNFSHVYPYVGEYDNYREMDADAKRMLKKYPDGYVCHVAHNAKDEYVLMFNSNGSEYIQLV